jgi:hypothetical protein
MFYLKYCHLTLLCVLEDDALGAARTDVESHRQHFERPLSTGSRHGHFGFTVMYLRALPSYTAW